MTYIHGGFTDPGSQGKCRTIVRVLPKPYTKWDFVNIQGVLFLSEQVMSRKKEIIHHKLVTIYRFINVTSLSLQQVCTIKATLFCLHVQYVTVLPIKEEEMFVTKAIKHGYFVSPLLVFFSITEQQGVCVQNCLWQ